MRNPSNNSSLLNKIISSYPQFSFKPSSRFLFHPPKTIYYDESSDNFDLLLLHELGHALIDKNSYTTDVERLKIERLAWEKARSLSKDFNISFDDGFAETELDSYRNWLHEKSRCKTCGLTRFQTPDKKYHCPRCDNLS